jgi:hypothetical protein
VRRQLVTDPQHPTIDLGDLFQVHEGRHLSNGLLAAGEGAVDCDGHVSVSDRLVTNDGHEGRKHEHDEADRHRCTNSGKQYGKHEQRCGPGEQGDVEWIDGADQERLQREEREHVHREGHRHCQHRGGGADVRFVTDVVRGDM